MRIFERVSVANQTSVARACRNPLASERLRAKTVR